MKFNVIQELYDSEIHGTVEWFWDGGFDVRLTDGSDGSVTKWRGWGGTLDVALRLLAQAATIRYPHSQFADRYVALGLPAMPSRQNRDGDIEIAEPERLACCKEFCRTDGAEHSIFCQNAKEL